jgi:restriction system protein
MAIPDYQTVMLPLLRFLRDGKEHSLGEAIDAIADQFQLTPDERQQLLPSGASTVIGNRVGWARTYLKKAGLIESIRRAFFRLTDCGQDVLKSRPERVDVTFLEQFPEFVAFRTLRLNDPLIPRRRLRMARPRRRRPSRGHTNESA